ncbi:hypothetical protein AS361_04860 [Myroides marinus]|uniref:UvrD-helicase domain-containing protein n=1 Tax=Myroides marinus TaxID=703342 RepID=UPI000742134A|nr:UvrD-helicase domain-containing protein [Myroides marinus]KUF46468.1 hypothetical protein AS361_04860 [Myroides marinus]
MSTNFKTELFNVLSVDLKDKNLIEASAGTGKTYSLAVMAVRLIIEQGLSTSEILMVTFTEKAVAELQTRVREFLRHAYKYSVNQQLEIDATIKQIVDSNSMAKKHLAKAMLELDQLNIYTIHSFCQQTLAEYAFHTKEAFNKELVPDISDYLDQFIQTFLREKLYSLSLEELTEINEAFTSIYDFSLYRNLLIASKQCHIQDYDELLCYYTDKLLKWNSSLKNKLNNIKANQAYKFVIDMFYQMTNDHRLQESLTQANIFSFDDLIINLSNNITPELIEVFKTKYKVLFIDEFQDTDAIQYKIFSTAFLSQTIFYIGDPKQSIYKFRNADIHTYFKAKSEVNHIYTLPKNYRSAPSLVQAVNHLFDDNRFTAKENAFCFPIDNPQIKHLPIEAVKQFKDYLTYKDHIVKNPFYINEVEKNNYSIAYDILSFLSFAKHNNKPILPNQIAFIARKNSDLIQMKKDLAELKVPAVILQEEKIFQTEESNFILSVLKAIQSRSIKQITQVIGHRLFNIELNTLPKIEYTQYIESFYSYNEDVYIKGIYEVLMRFYTDFDIQNLVDKNIKKNIQFWANLNQIAEQLQHIQTQDRLSLEEIISKIEQGNLGQDDIFQTRIESDEKAVQLLTIHKSKGLEFDYVFTSDLNFGSSTTVKGVFKYYDPTRQSYIADVSIQNIGYYNDHYKQSEDQEDRRILYVLLTRAKYGIFCYSERKSRGGFFKNFLNNSSSNFFSCDFHFDHTHDYYITNAEEIIYLDDVKLEITDKDWKKISYSYLSGPYQHYPAINSQRNETSYDQFIFEDLTKGITTGNLIHNLFEYIDFTNPNQWDKVIQRSISRYAPNKKELYSELLHDFVKHIMYAKININDTCFQLSNISNQDKINELEFDFIIDKLQLNKIKHLSNPAVQIDYIDSNNYYGIFNGLIDLVFIWEGKYYILDWKTNHIGNQTQDYTQDKIQNAMTGNNYHLQYCVYTVALTKFLQAKLPNFDYDTHFGGVVYLFVRGMREGDSTGVFTNRLDKKDVELLQEAFS